MITKSGTNQFHGSGFWFLQRKNWNAMDPIADYNPSLNANTYGGSIGGPIIKETRPSSTSTMKGCVWTRTP